MLLYLVCLGAVVTAPPVSSPISVPPPNVDSSARATRHDLGQDGSEAQMFLNRENGVQDLAMPVHFHSGQAPITDYFGAVPPTERPPPPGPP